MPHLLDKESFLLAKKLVTPGIFIVLDINMKSYLLPRNHRILATRWAQTMDGREVECNVVLFFDKMTMDNRKALFIVDTNEYVCDLIT